MPEGSGLRALLSELRRRRVFRVAGAYVLVAWAIIEVADTILPRLALPDWTVTLVIALLLLGFPVALVLAWAYDVTPDGVRRAEPAPARAGGSQRRRSVWFVLGILVALTGAWFALERGREEAEGPALDATLVAVLPFRVAGADPELAYLREGMLDLLATKLTGEGGPRAVDPRSLMSAWRRMAGEEQRDLPPDSSRLLARRLGAGQLVLGELVSTPGRISVSASLHRVTDGRVEQPVSVEGPIDSLPALVDRLAAALLSVGAGESDRLASLTSTSLPALRAYLDGQALYRRAHYAESEQKFTRALELDSTFALAAIGLHQSMLWSLPPRYDAPSLQIAWANRERLSPRDRVFLDALAGPRYPASSPWSEHLAAWERAVEQTPDRAEAWFEVGDLLMHYGALLDLERPWERAEAAFRRATELDPGFAAAVQHLSDLVAQRRDSAAYYRYSEQYLALEPSAFQSGGVGWVRGTVFGDSTALASARPALDTARAQVAYAVLVGATMWNVGYDLAEHAADVILQQARTAEERREAARGLHDYLLNRGRPARALELTARLGGPGDPLAHLRVRLEDALYAGGETAAAEAAARELAGAPELGWRERCVLAQWRARRGDAQGAAAEAAALRAGVAELQGRDAVSSALCAELLETLVAVSGEGPDAAARAERLDSLLATGPDAFPVREHANLTLARLRAERGEHQAALRAARRRASISGAERYLSSFLREQARLAALVGERDEAIGAYEHYLALMAQAEPSMRPEVEQARRELARLVGER